ASLWMCLMPTLRSTRSYSSNRPLGSLEATVVTTSLPSPTRRASSRRMTRLPSLSSWPPMTINVGLLWCAMVVRLIGSRRLRHRRRMDRRHRMPAESVQHAQTRLRLFLVEEDNDLVVLHLLQRG